MESMRLALEFSGIKYRFGLFNVHHLSE